MTERPKAAVLCRTFLSYSETFIYDELTHHVRWDVDVFCRERANAERFPYAGVRTIGTGLSRYVYQATSYSPSFERALRTGGHRLIHAHYGTTAIYALLPRWRLDLPLVVTFHGFDVGVLVGNRQWRPWVIRYRALARPLLARADLILCPSEEFRGILVGLGARESATRLYRIGIDLERFRPRSSRPPMGRLRVIMIGRFVEKKGHLDGLSAFAAAVRRGADAELVIIGAGPLEAAYRTRIAELGIADRVELPGVLGADAIAEHLAHADVLLAPSRVASDGDRESGVIVIKEASACAVAVIGTRHGGIPEIIEDGVTGFLVDEGDTSALAERLTDLLGDAALRTRLGEAGRRKMEREYDVRVRVQELERLYDEVA